MKLRILIPLAILLAVAAGFYVILWAPNTFEGDRFIIVSKGENFQQVLDSLQHAGIIRSRFLIDVAGRLLASTTKMQIGKYRFKSGMSNKDILDDIKIGKSIEAITVTIPEGLRATRMAKLLVKNLGIDSARFMELVYDSSFAHKLGVADDNLMGYLMPNTYRMYWQASEEQVITDLVGEFWKVFDDSLRSRTAAMGQSIHQILTMASIVEMETARDSERAIIAGVYYNRLRRRMRLQADPTIEFVLDGAPRRLYDSDLLKQSAYNTYLHYGLPPGPISNPGKASILAALYPAKHKYLFFVATGAGGHSFSRTYQQHLRAKKHLNRVREEQQATRESG